MRVPALQASAFLPHALLCTALQAKASVPAVQALFAAGETKEGRAAASSAMRLCPSAALNSSADAAALADWLSSAWDYL